MVGERGDRDREAVRWELGDDQQNTTPPPFSNGGMFQMAGSGGGGGVVSQYVVGSTSGGGDIGEMGGGAGSGTTGGYINEDGQTVSGYGGSTGKEVRYAPFPVTSPSNSNLQNPLVPPPMLQRAHSR